MLISSVVFCAGCQALSIIECQSKDWYQQGVVDGELAKDALFSLMGYQQRCSNLTGAANTHRNNYLRGYQQGNQQFCTFEKGQQLAIAGKENPFRCSGNQASLFNQGFTKGLSELCTKSGGENLGKEAIAYNGSCPAVSNQTFISGYTTGLRSIRPKLYEQLTYLENELQAIKTTIYSLEHDLFSIDSSRLFIRNTPMASRIHKLRSRRTDTTLDLYAARATRTRIESQLTSIQTSIDTTNSMLGRWSVK